jgi:acetyl esterase/lipase
MTADRPPFDVELEPALANVPDYFVTLEPHAIPDFRAATTRHPPLEEILAGRPVEFSDHAVMGHDGAEITVSVLRRTGHEDAAAPGVVLLHGGGMVGGSRWSMLPMLVEWVLEYDAVAAAVEYRLAPEFPDPAPVEDCAAGFQWFLAHAADFRFDPRRVLIGGQSAGGGLAAGATLLARDRGDSMPSGMLLMWPMLDDRNDTLSAHQVDGAGIWDRTSNATGWTALLGERRGTDDVSISAAPARATDLTGLPPAYIEAGSVEVFRDEAIEFANRIWRAGGSAELHIWAGGFHGFQAIVPTAAVSKRAVQTREAWVRGRLS